LLDGLWHQLGLDQVILSASQSGRGRPRDLATVERVLFGLVANRCLAPSSKLAATEWMTQDVVIPGLPAGVDDDTCYRAMDWLWAHQAVISRAVFDHVSDRLNLEVDLLFFDTTSTYFETDAADESGFRTWGKGKDGHDELPQIIIGMAVTRSGIPVRVWCWPGNTNDQALIRQARSELRDWCLSRVVWCADRGFASAHNRRELMAGGDGYILGEKLRCGTPDAAAALSRPGRYHRVADNLHVKEVRLHDTTGATDRLVVCLNPDQVTRDADTRKRLVARLTDMINDTDGWTAQKRLELKGRISTMPGLNRFLRLTETGLLRVDQAAIDTDARYDGKYLLRTSSPTMTPEDIALGYKQLLQVEAGWRTMKSTLDLRPVYHHLEHRIRAHVLLCWLGLLLIRVTENTTRHTWNHVTRQLNRVYQIDYDTPDGTITTHTRLTPDQTSLYQTMRLTPPDTVTITPT
jgi:transposase